MSTVKAVYPKFDSLKEEDIMAKKETTPVVENTTITENMVKFVMSEDIPNAMKAIVFTPAGWNGMYQTIGLYDALSCINAIQEFLGKTVTSAGESLHVRSQSYSLYDGVKSFYVGDEIVLKAINSGLKSVSVNVNGKTFNVSLPTTSVNIGPWAQVNTRLGNWANAVPCKDTGHMINLAKKHEALELLFRGTKLVIFTEPSMTKGEVFTKASDAAKVLQERILSADGTIKAPAEIAEAYFASKREYISSNKLNATAQRIAKLAPVMNLTVATVIMVDGKSANVTEVPAGRYLYQENGVEKVFTHVRNLDSQNALILLASRGRELTTQRKF